MTDLTQRISKIEARNARVESDKSWETSNTRRILLVLFTYLVMVLFMNAIGVDRPLVSAIIPSLGFLLSTLSLSLVKNLWLKYFYRKINH